jgi:hypothetical protein
VAGKTRRSRAGGFLRHLVVQLGVATEALNRGWYERNTGRVLKDIQRRVRHPVNRWMAATLDGWWKSVNIAPVPVALALWRSTRSGAALDAPPEAAASAENGDPS